MPVEDFLAPGENIRYSSPRPVNYNGEPYDFYITNRRLLWHKRTGLVFKKDKINAEVIEDVKTVQYFEKGIARKKGILKVAMGDRTMEDRPLVFSGSVDTVRAIYSNVQALMKYGEKKEPVHVHVSAGGPGYASAGGPSHVATKEVVREVVKIPCKYCDTLIPLEVSECPNCGARLKR